MHTSTNPTKTSLDQRLRIRIASHQKQKILNSKTAVSGVPISRYIRHRLDNILESDESPGPSGSSIAAVSPKDGNIKILISGEQYQKLRNYADKWQIPMSRVIAAALEPLLDD